MRIPAGVWAPLEKSYEWTLAQLNGFGDGAIVKEAIEILKRLEAIEGSLAALSQPWPEWMDLDVLSAYSGIPVETLWRFVKRKRNPLPCSQPGGPKGLVRVHRVTFDRWMVEQPRNGNLSDNVIDAMVAAAITSTYQGKDREPH